MPTRGRNLAIIFAPLVVLVLAAAVWRAWPHLVFWWRFEPLGLSTEGYLEYRHRQTGIVFVRLPGGTFQMGSRDEERYHEDDEGPVHEVTVSPFLIGKREVTQGQWRGVMGGYPSRFDWTVDYLGKPVGLPGERDLLPVETVSWDDIQTFEERTSLRLPTEAQWEFACRGGTETAFSFGSGESWADWVIAPCPERDAYMWYGGDGGDRTHEVGTKRANPLGLHDTHGNVWEWMEDVYSGDFYSTPEATRQDPLCTAGSEDRVCRGGSWVDGAGVCRSANRNRQVPGRRNPDLGFRAAYYPLP